MQFANRRRYKLQKISSFAKNQDGGPQRERQVFLQVTGHRSCSQVTCYSCPNQQINANRKQTGVKANRKQTREKANRKQAAIRANCKQVTCDL